MLILLLCRTQGVATNGGLGAIGGDVPAPAAGQSALLTAPPKLVLKLGKAATASLKVSLASAPPPTTPACSWNSPRACLVACGKPGSFPALGGPSAAPLSMLAKSRSCHALSWILPELGGLFSRSVLVSLSCDSLGLAPAQAAAAAKAQKLAAASAAGGGAAPPSPEPAYSFPSASLSASESYDLLGESPPGAVAL